MFSYFFILRFSFLKATSLIISFFTTSFNNDFSILSLRKVNRKLLFNINSAKLSNISSLHGIYHPFKGAIMYNATLPLCLTFPTSVYIIRSLSFITSLLFTYKC